MLLNAGNSSWLKFPSFSLPSVSLTPASKAKIEKISLMAALIFGILSVVCSCAKKPFHASVCGWASLASFFLAFCFSPITTSFEGYLKAGDKKKVMEHLQHGGYLVKKMTISSFSLEDADLKTLIKYCPTLEHLDLANCKELTNEGLALLKELPSSLKSLKLNLSEKVMGDKGITDASLSHLKKLPFLTKLDLEGANISDEGLSHLKELSSLQELNLNHCQNITDGGLSYLSQLSSLECLKLMDCNISGNTVGVKAFTSLKRLALSNATDEGLKEIKAFPHLIFLGLSVCQHLTDEGLSHLQGLSTLAHLYLVDCPKITDESFEHSLTTLSSLSNLTLAYCSITNQGLKHLKKLSLLTELSLNNCSHLTDAALNELKCLTLKKLNIENCENITKECLTQLKSLPCLKSLIYNKEVII